MNTTPAPKEYFVPLRVILPKPLFDALRDRCADEDITVSQGMRVALREWLDEESTLFLPSRGWRPTPFMVDVPVRDGIL